MTCSVLTAQKCQLSVLTYIHINHIYTHTYIWKMGLQKEGKMDGGEEGMDEPACPALERGRFSLRGHGSLLCRLFLSPLLRLLRAGNKKQQTGPFRIRFLAREQLRVG